MSNAWQPPPRGYKPFRDVRVPVRSVPCPQCEAPVGEPCRNDGNDVHTSRRRMAIRKTRVSKPADGE